MKDVTAVTDMEHVREEIEAHKRAIASIMRARRFCNMWQMEYRKRKKGQKK